MEPIVLDLSQKPLLEEDLNKNAMKQFKSWFDEAKSSGVITEVEAAVLTTVDKDSKPRSRSMKILEFNKRGFIFITSLSSDKVKQFTQNPNVSLVFSWIDVNRQVIVNGTVKKMNDEKSEMYVDKYSNFWGKVGMTINKQSSKVDSRQTIETMFNKNITKYNGDNSVYIKPPKHMCAFMIIPQSMEFFQSRSYKHPENTKVRRTWGYSDRIKYTKKGSKWSIVRYWA